MSVKDQVFAALKAKPLERMDIVKLQTLCDEAEGTTQIADACWRLTQTKGTGIERAKNNKGRFEYWFDISAASEPGATETASPKAEMECHIQHKISRADHSEIDELQAQLAHRDKIIDDQRNMIQTLRDQSKTQGEQAAGILYPEPPYYLVCMDIESFPTLEQARAAAEEVLKHQTSVAIAIPLQIAERQITWRAAA